MSLDMSGSDNVVTPAAVTISVTKDHPLIKLANALPWALLIALVVPDLKRTTAKGCWWMGRRLLVRVHLAAYILQKLYDLTDRQVEYGLKDNVAYQLFAGFGIVAGWRPPDHTKVEEFRSRLSPETQRQLANETAKVAVALGFAVPSDVDIDSTVQEANIAYPADANLMTKLAGLGRKVIDFLKRKTRGLLPGGIAVDMKSVKSKAKRRQRVLERAKPMGSDVTRNRERTATTDQYREQAWRAESGGARGPPQPTSRDRGVNRSHQARRTTREKSHEERRGNAGRRVRICPRLQPSTIDSQASQGGEEGGSVDTDLRWRSGWRGEILRSLRLPQDSRWRETLGALGAKSFAPATSSYPRRSA